MKCLRQLLTLLVIGLATIKTYSQPVQVPDSAETALVQRIFQYESVLGSELKPKVAFCVDEAMGKSWFLGDAPTLEIRKSLVEKLRRSAETCAVVTSTEKARLAAELRAMTERQLKLAQRLEVPIAAARVCVTTSPTPMDFRTCLTKALGKPPAEVDWGYWMVLFERKT